MKRLVLHGLNKEAKKSEENQKYIWLWEVNAIPSKPFPKSCSSKSYLFFLETTFMTEPLLFSCKFILNPVNAFKVKTAHI